MFVSAKFTGQTMNSNPSYRHIQRAPLCLLLYALGFLFLAIGWLVRSETPLQWIFIVVGPVILVLAGSFHHLTVEDEGDDLSVSFGPIRLFGRRVPYTEIVSVEIGRTTLLEGWGIHMSLRGGWVWNLWGRDCIVLTLEKDILRIGTNDAQQLMEFLRTRTAEVRETKHTDESSRK